MGSASFTSDRQIMDANQSPADQPDNLGFLGVPDHVPESNTSIEPGSSLDHDFAAVASTVNESSAKVIEAFIYHP